jgi:hypothetical protein
MLAPFNRKVVSITPPAAIVDNAAVTTATIDTAGFDYLVINLYLGATDIAVAAAKVQEADAVGEPCLPCAVGQDDRDVTGA